MKMARIIGTASLSKEYFVWKHDQHLTEFDRTYYISYNMLLYKFTHYWLLITVVAVIHIYAFDYKIKQFFSAVTSTNVHYLFVL